MACESQQAAFDTANQAALDSYDAEDTAVAAVGESDAAVTAAEESLATAQNARSEAVATATQATQDADAAESNAAAAYIALQTCLRDGDPDPAPAAFFNRTRRRV